MKRDFIPTHILKNLNWGIQWGLGGLQLNKTTGENLLEVAWLIQLERKSQGHMVYISRGKGKQGTLRHKKPMGGTGLA
jgi:hypothetical protein